MSEFIVRSFFKPTEDTAIIQESLLPLIETSENVSTQLATMLLIYNSRKFGSLQEYVDTAKTKFSNIYSIIMEHNIQMPEEMAIVTKAIKRITEEGEAAPAAPTNTTAGIEPTTPRIKRKQSKEIDVISRIAEK